MSVLEKTFRYPRHYLKQDLIASVVVFLVAIPLCLGIALASGAPLFSGIIAGVIGGIVVGMISESAVSVSGPSTGTLAIVIAAITQLGSFEVFLLALLMAGILQIIIGSLRAGFIADYIPSNVIQGLLCAMGILIVIKQLPFAFTFMTEHKELMISLREAAGNFTLPPLEEISDHINIGATIISVISIGLLLFFDKTKNTQFKAIPGPVVVVVVGALLNEIFTFWLPDFIQFSTELVNIPVHGSFLSFVKQFQFPVWEQWNNPNVYLFGSILAIVVSLEALLNVEAIEKLDSRRRYCSRNRELVAQGIGNITSGLIGGLPITSVIVRSSVNMQAGGKTKLSTIMHGLLILIVAVLIPNWINLIPLASLAAILIYIGFKLTAPSIYKNMYAQGNARFIPFIITTIAIICTNLLTGILIGLFFGFFFILRDNSKIQLDIINEQHVAGVVKRLVLPQHMSFLCKAGLVAELESIPPGTQLIIDARYAQYIDQDILEVLNVFVKNQAPDKNIAVNRVGFKEHYEIHNHIDFLNVTTYDTQSSLTPSTVFNILKEGNKRFMEGKTLHRSSLDDVKATSGKQHPIAIVLGCIDSRVPIETIFDMGVGDVFVVRIAGNVLNEDILASMEFACHISGAKLIVVLGHTYCGAIQAACNGNKVTDHLDKLLEKVNPAIKKEVTTNVNRTSSNKIFVDNVTRLNIENTLQAIYNGSNVLNQLIKTNAVGLVGAIYDVESGAVTFQEELRTYLPFIQTSDRQFLNTSKELHID